MGRRVVLPSVRIEERRKQPKPFGRIPENVQGCNLFLPLKNWFFRRKKQFAESRRAAVAKINYTQKRKTLGGGLKNNGGGGLKIYVPPVKN